MHNFLKISTKHQKAQGCFKANQKQLRRSFYVHNGSTIFSMEEKMQGNFEIEISLAIHMHARVIIKKKNRKKRVLFSPISFVFSL